MSNQRSLQRMPTQAATGDSGSLGFQSTITNLDGHESPAPPCMTETAWNDLAFHRATVVLQVGASGVAADKSSVPNAHKASAPTAGNSTHTAFDASAGGWNSIRQGSDEHPFTPRDAYSAARPTPGVTMSSISISLALLAVALASGMRKARMRMAVASGRRGRRFGSRRRLVGVASRSACVACAGLQQSSNRPGRSDSLPSWRVHSAWCSPRCASKHGFAASLLRSTLGGQCTMPVASSGTGGSGWWSYGLKLAS